MAVLPARNNSPNLLCFPLSFQRWHSQFLTACPWTLLLRDITLQPDLFLNKLLPASTSICHAVCTRTSKAVIPWMTELHFHEWWSVLRNCASPWDPPCRRAAQLSASHIRHHPLKGLIWNNNSSAYFTLADAHNEADLQNKHELHSSSVISPDLCFALII